MILLVTSAEAHPPQPQAAHLLVGLIQEVVHLPAHAHGWVEKKQKGKRDECRAPSRFVGQRLVRRSYSGPLCSDCKLRAVALKLLQVQHCKDALGTCDR